MTEDEVIAARAAAGTPNVGDVIRTYMKLREQKVAVEAEVKDRVSNIKAKMEKLEVYLKTQMDAQGLTSFKSDYGTAFLTTTDYANVADWDAVLDFVRSNDAYDMLEKRVSKLAVRGYIEQSKAVPPGITYGTKLEVNIRKPGAKAED
jgi:peptidyl-tRNA hydrolase